MTEKREKIIEEILAAAGEKDFPSPAVSRRGKPHTTVDLSRMTADEVARRDGYFMDIALRLAQAALDAGEVPVGALVVRGDEIISADYNGRESEKNALYHAECAVIEAACRTLGGWRLPGCELFVTLEPCIMCAGAVISARVPRVVFGARDDRAGFFGSAADARSFGLNHTPTVTSGVREAECLALLKRFFAKKR